MCSMIAYPAGWRCGPQVTLLSFCHSTVNCLGAIVTTRFSTPWERCRLRLQRSLFLGCWTGRHFALHSTGVSYPPTYPLTPPQPCQTLKRLVFKLLGLEVLKLGIRILGLGFEELCGLVHQAKPSTPPPTEIFEAQYLQRFSEWSSLHWNLFTHCSIIFNLFNLNWTSQLESGKQKETLFVSLMMEY